MNVKYMFVLSVVIYNKAKFELIFKFWTKSEGAIEFIIYARIITNEFLILDDILISHYNYYDGEVELHLMYALN